MLHQYVHVYQLEQRQKISEDTDEAEKALLRGRTRLAECRKCLETQQLVEARELFSVHTHTHTHTYTVRAGWSEKITDTRVRVVSKIGK